MSSQKMCPALGSSAPYTQRAPVKSFILVGGFLGAGKTSCLAALAEWLKEKNLKCGIITNDQGDGLVDTRSAKETGAAVSQIAGGCFCCKFQDLVDALGVMEKTAHPDVFLAEPVGSCTDLMATVIMPLKSICNSDLRRAPLSVVLDASRAWLHYFGPARTTRGFSRDVRYIYLKQIEEAEILVVNKADLLVERERKRLRERLARDWPKKPILFASAKSGEGLKDWFGMLFDHESTPIGIMDVDYDRYGKGEALLGWYNAALTLGVKHATIDGNVFLLELAQAVQTDLQQAGVEIAHFKMSLQQTDPSRSKRTGILAVVNAVRNNCPPELSKRMTGLFTKAELLINLRAEGRPKLLAEIVAKNLRGLPVCWDAEVAFRPGKPRPTHRVAAI